MIPDPVSRIVIFQIRSSVHKLIPFSCKNAVQIFTSLLTEKRTDIRTVSPSAADTPVSRRLKKQIPRLSSTKASHALSLLRDGASAILVRVFLCAQTSSNISSPDIPACLFERQAFCSSAYPPTFIMNCQKLPEQPASLHRASDVISHRTSALSREKSHDEYAPPSVPIRIFTF